VRFKAYREGISFTTHQEARKNYQRQATLRLCHDVQHVAERSNSARDDEHSAEG
jgi:hypothetical protein